MSLPSKKIAVLISGSGTNLQAVIDACDSGKISGKVVLVISDNPDAYGLIRAKKHKLNTYLCQGEEELTDLLKNYQVDVILLAGYLKVIPPSIIHRYRNQIINIHPSLIPAFCGKGYYGLKIHEKVVERGVRYTGVTTHFVDETTDGGPIIFQEIVPVEGENPTELQQKVLHREHCLLVKTMAYFCDNRLEVKGHHVLVKGVEDCKH
ncbi:MAG: phosphoribosylglycinamide formyltransferase [Tissierellia bacterium]|nr:phosphoribosylglycinamide formyltransferase [Tissierellia bacterium]